MGGTEETTHQQGKPILKPPQICEELEELRIKKLHAEIDSSIDNMVSCRMSVTTPRADVENLKSMGNATNWFKNWANITQDQFVLHMVKFGLTMEFAKVPVCQFVPPLNFLPAGTELIDAEISKLLRKGFIEHV